MSKPPTSRTYFIVLGEMGMFGLSHGLVPADAVALFCDGVDTFGAEELDPDYSDVAKALLPH